MRDALALACPFPVARDGETGEPDWSGPEGDPEPDAPPEAPEDAEEAFSSHDLAFLADTLARVEWERGHNGDALGRTMRSAALPALCQFLDGEATERKFCGRRVKAGSSFCAAHHRRCYVVRRRRRRSA